MAKTVKCVIGDAEYITPPLSIGALEDGAMDIISRIGSADTGLSSARAMLELLVMSAPDAHLDIGVLRNKVTMADFPALNQWVVDLLEISGMGAQPGDPAPGEAQATS